MKNDSGMKLLLAVSLIASIGAGCVRTGSPEKAASLPRRLAPAATTAPEAGPAATGTPEEGRPIYLTFDADMTPGMLKRLRSGRVASWYDPSIIETLDAERVPATIFVTGLFAEAYPELIGKLASEGSYAFGNHSYDHAGFESPCYGLPTVSTDAAKLEEISKTQRILEGLTGRAPTLFRYPGLCRSAHDDALVASAGLRIDDGSVFSGDAFNRNPDAIARSVMSAARPGGVILMHLGGPNAPATGAALKVLIPKLRKHGYRFELLR